LKRFIIFVLLAAGVIYGFASCAPADFQGIANIMTSRTPDPSWQPYTATSEAATSTHAALLVQATADAAEINRATAVAALQEAYSTQTAIPALTQAEEDARRAHETNVAAEYTRSAQEHTAELTQAAEERQAEQAWLVIGWTATADMQRANSERSAQETAAAMSLQLTSQALGIAATDQAIIGAAQQTVVAAKAESAALAVERTRYTNKFYAVMQVAAWPLIFLIVAGIGFTIFYMLHNLRVLQPNDRGKLPVILKKDILINPNKTFYPVTATTNPQNPPDALQAQLDKGEAYADIVRAIPGGNGRDARQVARTGAPTIMTPIPALNAPEASTLPYSADFRLLREYQGALLPVGVDERGLLLLNPESDTAPSLIFAGTTGSGKTRYGIKPFLAGALLHYHQAIILDQTGIDYQLFRDHPNVYIQRIDEAADVIGFLSAAAGEIKRREDYLIQNNASTWGRLPLATNPPRVFIVIDEFSSLGDSLGREGKTDLWRYARIIAARGRKAGIHLVIAVQNPTASSIDPAISRNMTKVVFKVQDQPASLAILNAIGAELLDRRQFLTTLGGLHRGMAFDPDDNALGETLHTPSIKLQEPEFLFAAAQSQGLFPDIEAEINREEQVLELYSQGQSINGICRQVFGYTGGSAFDQVRDIIERGNTGITTPDAPATPTAER